MKKILILALILIFLAPALSFADETQNFSVSATVPATETDFSTEISALTQGSEFSEDNEVEYQITYGSSLSYAVDLTLEASWTKGTISGESNPTVEVVDYVAGSATSAYGSTSPVVDTTNRKISWTISSFPANTSQTVKFKLKTNSNYKDSSTVSFSSKSRILGPGVNTNYNTVTKNYKYAISSTSSSSSPTPTPSASPVATVSAKIKTVEVREIGKDYASIFVQTQGTSFKTLYFGKTPTNLISLASGATTPTTLIALSKLTPKTKYYFKVFTKDALGLTNESDIYTFTTSEDSTKAAINAASLVATSNEIILTLPYSQAPTTSLTAKLVLPESTNTKFKFALVNSVQIESIQIVIRKSKVLSAVLGTPETEASTDAIEVSRGIYEVSLKTPAEPGDYDVIARIKDTKGNITEQKIAEVRASNSFTVLDSGENPVEGARVQLFIYSPSNNKYILIPSVGLLVGNPLFTDKNGRLKLALPYGKYRAYISNIGYADKWLDFTIGSGEKDNLPIVVMEKESVSAYEIVRFYFRGLNDVLLKQTQIYVLGLTGSLRFFDLTASFTLLAFVVLTFLAFSKKHHISLSNAPSYFFYLLDHKGNQHKYINGFVMDENEKPIPSANIYLTDKQNEEIIASTKTNKEGEFFFKVNSKDKEYYILAMARTYKTGRLTQYKDREHVSLKITLEKQEEGLNLIENISRFTGGILGMTFEGLSIVTFLFEVFFIANFGLVKTLPFLAISIFNLVLWSLYLRHRHTI